MGIGRTAAPGFRGREAMGTTQARHPRRRHVSGLVAVVVIVGCTVVCCGSGSPAATPPPTVTPQECEQAVFTALSGMITEPSQDRPFEDLVARYGTSSRAYAAYQDSFDQFYGQAVAHGLHTAEDYVRPTITKDCTT
jgi:hypothetical protein